MSHAPPGPGMQGVGWRSARLSLEGGCLFYPFLTSYTFPFSSSKVQRNGANAFSIGATGKSYRCIVPKRMCLQTSMPPSVTCEYARCSSRVQLLPAAQEEAEGEENSRGSLFFHSAFFASFKHLPLTLGIPGHCCCDWNHCRLDLQKHHPEIVGLASHPVPLQSAPYE